MHTDRLAIPACAALLLAALVAWPAAGRAQTRPADRAGAERTGAPASASLSGRVLDASSLAALEGARVTLVSAEGRVIREAATDGAGSYRMLRLTPGNYTVEIAALGYRTDTLHVRLRNDGAADVSIGLEMRPVALQRLEVPASALQLLAADPHGAAADARRVNAERQRIAAGLAPDARVLTPGELREAVTFGDNDILRALQRVPGVTRRDDYSAALWTRGAAVDQTTVFLDGIPLFNPFHAVGAVFGVPSFAVGSATMYPGVLPTSLGSAASGAVALETRRATESGPHFAADMSLLSSQAAVALPLQEGRGGLHLTARRSHLDLQPFVGRASGSGRLPWWFGDVVARWDHALPGERSIVVSGVYHTDRLRGGVPGVLERSTAAWSGHAARATYSAPVRGGTISTTLASSSLDVDAWRRDATRAPAAGPVMPGEPYRIPETESSATWASASTLWKGGSAAHPVQFGAELVQRTAQWRTRAFWAYREDVHGVTADTGGIVYASLWAQAETALATSLSLAAGARVDAGGLQDHAVRPAPRVVLRWHVDSMSVIAIGASRSWQYSQTVVPEVSNTDAQVLTGVLWSIAGAGVPALRSDVATVGATRWLHDGVLFSANAFHRAADGAAVPDPAPGALLGRPIHVPSSQRARGVELSVRKLTGAFTGGLGYAKVHAVTDVATTRHSAATRRTHVFMGTAMLRLPTGLTLAAAAERATGAPYVRYDIGNSVCQGDPSSAECGVRVVRGETAEREGRHYVGIDIAAEYGAVVRGWTVGGFVRLHNPFGWNNPAAYRYSTSFCTVQAPATTCDPAQDGGPGSRDASGDTFFSGMSRIPSIGFRVAF